MLDTRGNRKNSLLKHCSSLGGCAADFYCNFFPDTHNIQAKRETTHGLLHSFFWDCMRCLWRSRQIQDTIRACSQTSQETIKHLNYMQVDVGVSFLDLHVCVPDTWRVLMLNYQIKLCVHHFTGSIQLTWHPKHGWAREYEQPVCHHEWKPCQKVSWS